MRPYLRTGIRRTRGGHFANAIKAIGKGNEKAIKSSIAYKALVRIGAIYNLEGALKELTAEERLKDDRPQSSIG